MPRVASSMKPLYERLKAAGLERQYVQAAILPDWWDDSLYDDESNRQLAQLSIARYFGVGVRQVMDLQATLFQPGGNHRLKRSKDADEASVAGAVAAAMYAARLTAELMKDRLPFTGTRPALEVRAQLLARPRCLWPDLPTLAEHCWEHGIGVVHVTRLPKIQGMKGIAGLATFVNERPVIVLCSNRDSPAWLAFHLAHELGHVMTGHVRPGEAPLVDVKLDGASDEAHEREADQYAFQVLTGYPKLELAGGAQFSGVGLAAAARSFGETHRIHPGTAALIYGYSHRRMDVAQTALKAMGQDSGAREILAAAFRRHVALDDLPDSARRSLSATTQVFGASSAANASL